MDFDDVELEREARTIIMEIMMVLHKHGIMEVHMGGLLRLMGVSEEKARDSDDDRVVLDEKFTKYIKEQVETLSTDKKHRTLH